MKCPCENLPAPEQPCQGLRTASKYLASTWPDRLEAVAKEMARLSLEILHHGRHPDATYHYIELREAADLIKDWACEARNFKQ